MAIDRLGDLGVPERSVPPRVLAADSTYYIAAGPIGDAPGNQRDFDSYRWSGKKGDAPTPVDGFGDTIAEIRGLHPEVMIIAPDGKLIRLLSDDGECATTTIGFSEHSSWPLSSWFSGNAANRICTVIKRSLIPANAVLTPANENPIVSGRPPRLSNRGISSPLITLVSPAMIRSWIRMLNWHSTGRP
jgi:hypothetical protein